MIFLLKKILPSSPKEGRATLSLALYFIAWLFVLAALNEISLKNYLLFHILVESFSIVIAYSVFTLAWNSRKTSPNNYLLIIGISLFFIAAIDFVHLMTYKGMGIFPGIDSNFATQLWLAARYLQGLSFLAAALWLFKKDQKPLKDYFVFFAYLAATAFIFLSIFYWRIFPAAYIENVGLTNFKKISEYIICAIFALSFFLLFKKRAQFSRPIFLFLAYAIALMILSEFFFTLYNDPYGLSNKIGHFLKIVYFYLIYRAIVVANIKDPLKFLLKNLQDKKSALSAALKDAQETSEALKTRELLYQESLIYTQGIIDTVKQPLLVLDEKLMVDSANKSFYKFFQTEPENTEKEHLSSIFHQKFDIQELIQKLSRVIPEDINFYDLEIITHDHSKIGKKTFLLSGKKIKSPGHRKPLILLSLDDITQRKQTEMELQETKDYLEKLIRHANAPIIVWDPQLKIQQFNHAFEQLSGFKFDEVLNKKICFLFPPDSQQEILEKIVNNAEGENKQIIEIPILCKDKAVKILLWSSANIYKNYYNKNQGEKIATIAQGQDITELKRIDKSKNEFLSMASHQLRTPLSIIRLSAEMLKKETENIQLSEDGAMHLKDISDISKEMTDLIETFLNVSRIEMETVIIDPRPSDLIKIVDHLAKEIMPLAKNKELKFKTAYATDLPLINLDKKILNLALENLLTNAIKYSDDKGLISLEVAKTDSEAVIKVSDSGWGIPKDQQAKIFEKMFRAENVKKANKTEGTGLGLYIVKFAMEKAGGRIWFESEENKGTTFYLAIPLSGMKEKNMDRLRPALRI